MQDSGNNNLFFYEITELSPNTSFILISIPHKGSSFCQTPVLAPAKAKGLEVDFVFPRHNYDNDNHPNLNFQ